MYRTKPCSNLITSVSAKLLLNMYRAIITAHNCLLFEPSTPQSKKFLEIVTPRLTASEGARALAEYRQGSEEYEEDASQAPPFELEMIEGALMVATGVTLWTTNLQGMHTVSSC